MRTPLTFLPPALCSLTFASSPSFQPLQLSPLQKATFPDFDILNPFLGLLSFS